MIYVLTKDGSLCQCFLEESRQLMRLPPRQSTAEADLMVPFQLVRLVQFLMDVLVHIVEVFNYVDVLYFPIVFKWFGNFQCRLLLRPLVRKTNISLEYP